MAQAMPWFPGTGNRPGVPLDPLAGTHSAAEQIRTDEHRRPNSKSVTRRSRDPERSLESPSASWICWRSSAATHGDARGCPPRRRSRGPVWVCVWVVRRRALSETCVCTREARLSRRARAKATVCGARACRCTMEHMCGVWRGLPRVQTRAPRRPHGRPSLYGATRRVPGRRLRPCAVWTAYSAAR